MIEVLELSTENYTKYWRWGVGSKLCALSGYLSLYAGCFRLRREKVQK